MSSTTEIVEVFIKRMSNGEITFDDKKSQEIKYVFAGKETRTFADAFSRALADYAFFREMADPMLPVKVNMAFLWINKAYLLNIVKPGPALFKKLEEVSNENEILRKELDMTTQRLAILEAARNQLGKVGLIGDVEDK